MTNLSLKALLESFFFQLFIAIFPMNLDWAIIMKAFTSKPLIAPLRVQMSLAHVFASVNFY